MKLVEFINKCDWEGGLAAGFESGLIPQSIDLFENNKDVRQAVYDAYLIREQRCAAGYLRCLRGMETLQAG